jgi:prenyltransferase beta subunit
MGTRRQFLQTTGTAFLGLSGLAPVRGVQQDEGRGRQPDGSASRGMITPATQLAIDQGLSYLAQHQHPDGSFGAAQYHGNVAITSLAGLAMMAGGHQPARGAYGDVVTRALRYVIERDNGQGFLKSRSGNPNGPMYEHGFGTLFLSEVSGMVQDRELRERLRETLKRAIKLIVDSQNPEGGWRYQPDGKDADVSVTICQIMGLRAARNAGFFVSKTTVDRCIKYVKNCQDRDGGFHYQQQGGSSQFARSAAGLVALYSAGVYKGPEIESALKYLMQYKPGSGGYARPDVHLHYYYGHYYAAQAMWTAGDPYWKEWYPAIRDELIGHQETDRQRYGCWTDHRFSNDYATAMACIILQIPNNYLPILQK